MEKPRILVVEDEYLTSADIRTTLTQMGYEVPGIADTGPEAIRMAGEFKPDLVLMDITLNGNMTGIEAARQIKGMYKIPVVFQSAHSDDATVEEATATEPFGYLVKPLDERAMKSTIQMALYKHAMDEKLCQSESMIRALLDATKDDIVLIDAAGKILALNEAFARNAGRSARDLVNTVIYDLVGTGGISMKASEEMQRRDAGSPITFVEEFHNRWLETMIYSITDSRNNSRQIALFRHDITPRIRIENNLITAKEQLQKEKERQALYVTALNEMSDCAVITDPVGNILCVNVAFEEKFALSKDAARGKHFSEFAHAENHYPLSKENFFHSPDADTIGLFIAKNAYGVKMPMTIRSRQFLPEKGRPKKIIFVLREHVGKTGVT